MTPEQAQRIAERLRGLGFTTKADAIEAKYKPEVPDAAQEVPVTEGVPAEPQG